MYMELRVGLDKKEKRDIAGGKELETEKERKRGP